MELLKKISLSLLFFSFTLFFSWPIENLPDNNSNKKYYNLTGIISKKEFIGKRAYLKLVKVTDDYAAAALYSLEIVIDSDYVECFYEGIEEGEYAAYIFVCPAKQANPAGGKPVSP